MGKNLGKQTQNYLYMFAAITATGLLGACNEPTTFVATATEQFVYDDRDYYQQASELLQADYLIVPDLSYSMKPNKEGLENALYEFSSNLQDNNIDYRVGFVRGTTQSRTSDLSVNQWVSYLPTSFIGSVLVPTSGASTGMQIVNGIAELGAPNAPNERVLLESAKRVIESQSSNFKRLGSQLVYVFISDADDEGYELIGSNRTTSYYANALAAQKSHQDHISARAFVTNPSQGCALTDSSSYGAHAGTRLASVAASLDAGQDSFRCLTDFADLADSLENLANDVSKPTRRFQVQANAKPASIEVRVNNVLVNPGQNTWSFHPNTNEVVFTEAAKPAESASVEITFDMKMTLERSPKLSSMVVTVDGEIVAQSNSNGWSLNNNTLELEFHGGAQPNNGQIVLVSYEVQ